MPTDVELTDPNLSMYVPPPPAGAGVCRVCHGASGGYVRCWSCNENRRHVTARPLELVVPVSLTRIDLQGQLHNVLRDYKYARDSEVRGRHQLHVAALLSRFHRHHRHCIEQEAGTSYDTITVVPSKSGRAGAHPLEQALSLVDPLRALHARLLDPGPAEIRRNAPAADGFVATRDAPGRRVLLVDDTLTSGAKLQSAAWTLTLAGATVVAGLVLGRVIDASKPNEYPAPAALWKRQARVPFSFETCCLESGGAEEGPFF